MEPFSASLLFTPILLQGLRAQSPFRLELLQTTDVATLVPEDIIPPSIGQIPSGLVQVGTVHSEQLVRDYMGLVRNVAKALPINLEADREVGHILTGLQDEMQFEDLDAVYEGG